MAAPTIHTQSASFTVYEGQTARFYVVAAGRGTITYQWEKSDNSGGSWSDVGGATSSSYTTAATVRTSDNGDQYRCKVTNADGTTTGSAITLTVWNPLAIGTDLAFWAQAGVGMYTERTGAAATTATTDGNGVGTWRGTNGAGTAINGTSISAAGTPVYRATGINGLPGIEFDGIDDAINYTTALAATFQNKSYGYIHIGIMPEIEAADAQWVSFSNNAAVVRAGLLVNQGGTAGLLMAAGRKLDADSGQSTTLSSGAINGEPFVLGGEYLWGSSDLHLLKNGVRVSSKTDFFTDGSTSNTASAGVWVGANSAGVSGFVDGMISQIVVCNPASPLSSDTLTHINNFIQWKMNSKVPDWGQTSRAVGVLGAATKYNSGIIIDVDLSTITENDILTHKYHHQNAIRYWNGRLHVAFTSSGTNEDGGGQQIGYAYSDDHGATWSTPVIFLPAQSAWSGTAPAFEAGKYIANLRRWIVYQNRLFLVMSVDSCDGAITNVLSQEGKFLACREVNTDGSFGTAFRISPDDYTALDGKTKLNYDSTLGPALFTEADVFGTAGGSAPGEPASDWGGYISQNSVTYYEPRATYRDLTNVSSIAKTMRDFTNGTAICYFTESTDGGATYGTVRKTNVPTSPSPVMFLRLHDGRFAMIGNVDADRTELHVAILSSDLVVQSAQYIVTGISPTPSVPGTYKIGGASYADCIQRGNYLYVTYSTQKEKIWFARVLIPGATDNSNHTASISVTAPTLDQQVSSGTIASITATTSGTSGTYHVYLSFDGGFSFPLQIGTSVSLPYSWSVADSHIQSNAMIRVVDSSDSNIIGDSQLFDVIESSGSGSGTVNLLLLGVG